ncbi:MAG: type II toxin-antitoxin system VapC family toxin [Candidatus Aminicenantes bacterium]|nr:MAG: type II toxin-antitoxin system VapC family toxin [Candidatus Aminicenantes bacterium]
MIWVVDASVAVRWFIEQESHPQADLILEKMLSQPERFAIPELFAFEVFSVLIRLHPRGTEVFLNGMIPVLQCDILHYPMTEGLARQASAFADRGLTGYDAFYAALAKELNGMWLTFDNKAHKRIQRNKLSHVISKSLPENWDG